MKKDKKNFVFDKFANHVTKATGKPSSFILAFSAIIIWGVTGPLFNFSDTWQLVINTGTTIITFLMVFIIQQTQNKDTMALQLKLNELIASNKTASNRLINIEDLTEDELEVIKKFYINLSILAQKEKEMDVKKTHSIEEATTIHKSKINTGKPAKRINP
jgi:low affinity Fe/Cu permease